jgi:hypothetical protein
MVSGAPWHMRTLGLDGGGNRNQDRSIQPSAVVGELPPAVQAPNPAPTANPPGSAPGGPTTPGARPTVPPTATAAPAPARPDRAVVDAVVLLAGGLGLAIVLMRTAPVRRRRR